MRSEAPDPRALEGSAGADTTATPPQGDRPGSSRRPEGSGRWIAIGVALVLIASGALIAIHLASPRSAAVNGGGPIPIVAAENFWGSLVSQLGGTHVHVLSIVSDPNADPHLYESNTSDAVAIANARLVIENGAGYDDWCQKIVTASATPNQVILNVATLLGKAPGDNPHFWYGAAYVNLAVAAMYSDLVTLDPSHALYYAQQYAALNASLAPVWAREAEIRSYFAGTPVASTESIFVYMANSTGLNLISPVAFMDAVAEGLDPPASSVTQFQNQLTSGNVSLLVYNAQTVTPLTQNMKAIAASHNVSIVAVTETIQPPDVPFQTWMLSELLALQNALNQKALGH